MEMKSSLRDKGESIDDIIKESSFYGLYQFTITKDIDCIATKFYYIKNEEYFKKILSKLFHKDNVKSVSYTKLSNEMNIIEDYENVSDLNETDVKEYLEVTRIGARYVSDDDFSEILRIINKAIDKYNNN